MYDFQYTPTIADDFEEQAEGLLRQRTSMLEDEILSFWRDNEPKKLERLFRHGRVRGSLRRQADDLLAVQKTMEDMEQLPPALAKMEAWNRLMRIEEDEAEEAEAWGMTVEEYRNRPCG